MDEKALRANGFTDEDVSRYLLGYTKRDGLIPGLSVSESELDDTVFAAAFPASLFSSLPCLPEAST
jgi:hypothetical protein